MRASKCVLARFEQILWLCTDGIGREAKQVEQDQRISAQVSRRKIKEAVENALYGAGLIHCRDPVRR